MGDVLVSVILPVYNAEAALKKCIESLLTQTYQKFELLIIDDGSTDNSVSVARLFQDDRVIVIESEHKGVSHARNIGLRNMRGQYFTFVDADDFVADSYIEVMLSDIRHFDADIAFTRMEIHYKNESFDYREAIDEKRSLVDNKQMIEFCFGLDENLRGYTAGVCSRMFRSDFYRKGNELFDEGFSFGEDSKWLFTLVMRAERVVLDEKTLYHYNRIRGKYTDYLANIRCHTWRLSFFRNHGFPERMISSTEKRLYQNQFLYLLQTYQDSVSFKNRIHLVWQSPKLWAWLFLSHESWNLGCVKNIICYLMMWSGIPGKQVMRVWRFHKV